MKTVLFIPGFQEDFNSRDYSSVLLAIKDSGYEIVFVPITWKRTTIDDWVEQLDKVYMTYDRSQTVLAGFSYGAMTALLSASRKSPSELWLFSLSPYFAEDLISKNMKATWLKNIGHRRVSAFSRLHFANLARSITCKTLLITGQAELDKWAVLNERIKNAHKLLKNNSLVIAKGAGHDVSDKSYIDAITKSI